MKTAKLYRVVSGQSCLNYYATELDATRYADKVIRNSGEPCQVEKFSEENGEYFAIIGKPLEELDPVEKIRKACREQSDDFLVETCRVLSEWINDADRFDRIEVRRTKKYRASRAAAIDVLIERHGEAYGDSLMSILGM